MRPGYAPTSNHGLPFVQNMGGAWDAIGYILQFGLLVLFIGMLAAIIPMWGEMMTFAQQHPGDREGMNNFIRTNSPGWLPVIQIFTFVFFVGNIVWTALDIADRKNSWAWMIVTVCCWPITVLYVVAGRK